MFRGKYQRTPSSPFFSTTRHERSTCPLAWEEARLPEVSLELLFLVRTRRRVLPCSASD